MNQADILAIKVAVQNVAEAQRKLGAIKQQLDRMDAQNSRNSQRQLSWLGRLKQAHTDLANQHQRSARTGLGVVESYGKIAAVFTSVAAAAGTMYASVKAFEGLDSTRKGLTNLLGSKDSAREVEKQVRALAKLTGTRATEMFPNVLKLAGTEQVKVADLVPTLRAFIALGKRGGANPEGLSRAFEQFTQIASQGQLQGDELRSIQENGVQLRALLKRAGLGDRIGSQTNPITFKEIQKALLAFGNSADATASLAIGSDNATASLNRLLDVLQLDILPIIGKVLTPAFAKLADLLRNFVTNISPARLQKLGDNIAQAVLALGQFAIEALPVLTNAILTAAPIVTNLVKTFTSLDQKLNGGLMKTLLAIAAIRVAGGVIGGASSAAGGAAGGWAAAVAAWFGKGIWKLLITAVTNFVLWFGAWAEGLPVVGTAIATFVTALGTAVTAASAAMVAAVVAVGAAIGLAIGWLINQIPGVQNFQRNAGEWLNDTFNGGAQAKENAAQAAPEWQPGGRLYEKWKAEREGRKGNPSAQSARRSDPQRLITEAGANGVRYAR